MNVKITLYCRAEGELRQSRKRSHSGVPRPAEKVKCDMKVAQHAKR